MLTPWCPPHPLSAHTYYTDHTHSYSTYSTYSTDCTYYTYYTDSTYYRPSSPAWPKSSVHLPTRSRTTEIACSRSTAVMNSRTPRCCRCSSRRRVGAVGAVGVVGVLGVAGGGGGGGRGGGGGGGGGLAVGVVRGEHGGSRRSRSRGSSRSSGGGGVGVARQQYRYIGHRDSRRTYRVPSTTPKHMHISGRSHRHVARGWAACGVTPIGPAGDVIAA